jgi:hypothetical protein
MKNKEYHIDNTPLEVHEPIESYVRSSAPLDAPRHINVTRRHYTSVQPPKYDALKENLKREIKELSSLPNNWDGYGALPVFDDCIANAIRVLSDEHIPSKDITEVYANTNGTVSIEWEHNDNLISVEFGKDSFAYYVDQDGHTYYEKEQPITNATIKRLADYARNL